MVGRVSVVWPLKHVSMQKGARSVSQYLLHWSGGGVGEMGGGMERWDGLVEVGWERWVRLRWVGRDEMDWEGWDGLGEMEWVVMDGMIWDGWDELGEIG